MELINFTFSEHGGLDNYYHLICYFCIKLYNEKPEINNNQINLYIDKDTTKNKFLFYDNNMKNIFKSIFPNLNLHVISKNKFPINLKQLSLKKSNWGLEYSKNEIESFSDYYISQINKSNIKFFDIVIIKRKSFENVKHKLTDRQSRFLKDVFFIKLTQFCIDNNLSLNIVKCEELTFLQQVSIFNNCKIIIGNHGAGLTNLIFSQKNTTIIELGKSQYDIICFKNLVNILERKYYNILNTEYNQDFESLIKKIINQY